jgi:hypothetical protein
MIQPAKVQLPMLPQGAGGPAAQDLVLAVNDRLRRISLGLSDLTGAAGPAGPPGAIGPPGPAGAPGGGPVSLYHLAAVGETFTPDASQPMNVILLTTDATLNLPANVPTDSTVLTWTLIVEQDGVGGHSLDSSAYTAMPYQLANAQSPASTECIQVFLSGAAGTRALYPAQMNVPIP